MTYTFDTWADYKKFMNESRHTLKVDDEVVINRPIFEGGLPVTAFKVVMDYDGNLFTRIPGSAFSEATMKWLVESEEKKQ